MADLTAEEKIAKLEAENAKLKDSLKTAPVSEIDTRVVLPLDPDKPEGDKGVFDFEPKSFLVSTVTSTDKKNNLDSFSLPEVVDVVELVRAGDKDSIAKLDLVVQHLQEIGSGILVFKEVYKA